MPTRMFARECLPCLARILVVDAFPLPDAENLASLQTTFELKSLEAVKVPLVDFTLFKKQTWRDNKPWYARFDKNRHKKRKKK